MATADAVTALYGNFCVEYMNRVRSAALERRVISGPRVIGGRVGGCVIGGRVIGGHVGGCVISGRVGGCVIGDRVIGGHWWPCYW